MAHKDIRENCSLSGRDFEFVGFLEDDESPVNGDEMLHRTGGALDDEDEEVVRECRADLPSRLRPTNCLVTGRRNPDNQRKISCLYFSAGVWYPSWVGLDDMFGEATLVVRRRRA